MKVTYVGPHDAVDVVGVGTVARGDTVDIPDEIAGRQPDPTLEQAHRDLATAIGATDHNRAKELREHILELDPGAGLLAQIDAWAPAKKKRGTPASAPADETPDSADPPADGDTDDTDGGAQ